MEVEFTSSIASYDDIFEIDIFPTEEGIPFIGEGIPFIGEAKLTESELLDPFAELFQIPDEVDTEINKNKNESSKVEEIKPAEIQQLPIVGHGLQVQQPVDMNLQFCGPKKSTGHDCQHCTYSCNTIRILDQHVKYSHPQIKMYKCEKCDKTFSLLDSKNKHMKRHEEKKQICPTCNKAFCSIQELQNHLPKHTGTKTFLCDIDGCKKAYGSKRSLSNHMQSAHGEKKFHCRCGKDFKMKHKINPKYHKCKE